MINWTSGHKGQRPEPFGPRAWALGLAAGPGPAQAPAARPRAQALGPKGSGLWPLWPEVQLIIKYCLLFNNACLLVINYHYLLFIIDYWSPYWSP